MYGFLFLEVVLYTLFYSFFIISLSIRLGGKCYFYLRENLVSEKLGVCL